MVAREKYGTYPSLKDTSAIVTGGATGIGAAIAETLAMQGVAVSVLDHNDEAGRDIVGRFPDLISFHQIDLTDFGKLEDTIDQCAAQTGGIDILVANAANDARISLEELTPELWDTSMAINLKHQFFAAKAVRQHMQSKGGSIVCLGSIAWLNETTEMPAYTSAKAGVHGLVRTLARLWGSHRIRVNAVLPGWTVTERQRRENIDADAEALIANSQCLPGHVMPEDIARMVAFLASDDARMITKQTFVVDGGWI